jgi:hypothetical protein
MNNFGGASAVWKLEVIAAMGLLAAGLAAPTRAEETTQGRGRVADVSGFRVVPNSRATIVAGVPGAVGADQPAGGSPKAGRTALGQPQCLICLGGASSVQWTGATGSFRVDNVTNYRSSGTSGPLDLKMLATVAQPVWGNTISGYNFSASVSLNPLPAGYLYSNVNSGTVAFFGSSIPAGQYFLLLYLRENVSGTFYYVDWIQMTSKITCDGVSGCTTVQAPPSCTEDANTMCLLGGRYRVTGRWKNQYAGGAQANLQKARLTDETGAFWIADANTYEFMIRVNTATDNGKAWMSILTFTDVEFWVAVTDVTNGQSKEYHSDPGNRTLIFDPDTFVYP